MRNASLLAKRHIHSVGRLPTRKTKEQHLAQSIDIAAHTRLPKAKLLGRSVATRAKMRGIALGALMPQARNAKVDQLWPRGRNDYV